MIQTTISNIEYTVPTQDNQIGELTFEVSVPILFKEGMLPIQEDELNDVTLPVDTVYVAENLAKIIITALTS